MTGKVRQGGLSNGVWWNSQLQDYVKPDYVFGYLGHSSRSKNNDIALEDFLANHVRLSDEGIAVWMTSTAGRHFADNLDRKDSLARARQRVISTFKWSYGDPPRLTPMDELRKWGDIERIRKD